jgi:hypothetical protein
VLAAEADHRADLHGEVTDSTEVTHDETVHDRGGLMTGVASAQMRRAPTSPMAGGVGSGMTGPMMGTQGAHGSMYYVEGAERGTADFHVNPWGNVMPFGGPRRRTG